jgi:hypothetical protein
MRHMFLAILFGLGVCVDANFSSLQAQEPGCPNYYDCGSDSVWSNGGTLGGSTNAIDLDLDGKQDFRLIDRIATGNRGEQIPHLICEWGDETQALFAEPHVQMYLSKEIWGGCTYIPPEARLTQGQTIPTKPALESTWGWIQPTNVARLKGIGFGWTYRTLRYGIPSTNPRISIEPGYLKLGPPSATNVLFGFRIQSTDGWHLGWVRLVFSETPKGGKVVQIADASVNPIPDQDVVAGVRTGTILAIRSGGTNSLQLSWSTNATDAVLEQKLKLSDPAWVTVPGITNNQYTVTPTNPSSFYRLKTAP